MSFYDIIYITYFNYIIYINIFRRHFSRLIHLKSQYLILKMLGMTLKGHSILNTQKKLSKYGYTVKSRFYCHGVNLERSRIPPWRYKSGAEIFFLKFIYSTPAIQMSVGGYRHGAIISFFNYRQGAKNEFLAIKSVFWR